MVGVATKMGEVLADIDESIGMAARRLLRARTRELSRS